MGDRQETEAEVVLGDPFEGEELLLEAVFGDRAQTHRKHSKSAEPKVSQESSKDATPASKPQHYKVVSISLYLQDIERLELYVKKLKERGHYKANKSQVIRHALQQLDLNKVIREP